MDDTDKTTVDNRTAKQIAADEKAAAKAAPAADAPEDKKVEDAPVVSNLAPTVAVDPNDPESAVQQHDAVDQRLADLNAHNESGFAKIVEREQAAAEAAQNNPAHVPTGKEWNHNTPVIDEHGNKQW